MNKKHFILFGLLMAIGMSGCISFFMTLFNEGITDHFIGLWWDGFYPGFLISLPFSYLLPILINKFLSWIGIEKEA